jgi:thioredoxin 2
LASAGDDDFDLMVSHAALPALVDLWAPWCGPCRLVGPAVEQAARAFAGRLKAVKVNVDEAPRASARFGVRSIPTLLLLDGERVVARHTGALPAEALHDWVERALGPATSQRR